MAVANRQSGKPGGGSTASPNGTERRYDDAIAWLERLRIFYRSLNDGNMDQLLSFEVERLARRRDAYTAVRLRTLTRNSVYNIGVVAEQAKDD